MIATLSFEVTGADTAAAVGSGSLPVLGTPRLLAWCEATTCAALEPTLAPGSTSVGIDVGLTHEAPSPVGAAVEVTARRTSGEGRTHVFEVSARHLDGTLIGRGRVTRAVVDAERFLSRLGG